MIPLIGARERPSRSPCPPPWRHPIVRVFHLPPSTETSSHAHPPTARRQQQAVPRRHPAARRGRVHRQAARPGRRRRQGRWRHRRSRPRDSARRRRQSFQILTEKDPEALDVLRHSSRPRHGPRRHAALPRRAARLRPAARERLLLRHRLAHADPRGGFPAHRGGDAQDRRGGRAVRALRAARPPRPAAWCEDLEPGATRSSTSTTT